MTEPVVDAGRVLDLIPVPNRAVREETRAGATILYTPIEWSWWLRALSWLLPVRRERGFALDALGQEVWRECDGERTIEMIVDAFASRHRVRFHEARQAVLQFLKMLSERKLIAMLLDSSEEA
ncbi:MAG TPA: PqqD family protein [Polyangiaceae bacterium]